MPTTKPQPPAACQPDTPARMPPGQRRSRRGARGRVAPGSHPALGSACRCSGCARRRNRTAGSSVPSSGHAREGNRHTRDYAIRQAERLPGRGAAWIGGESRPLSRRRHPSIMRCRSLASRSSPLQRPPPVAVTPLHPASVGVHPPRAVIGTALRTWGR